MRINYIWGMLSLCWLLPAHAQKPDSLKTISLSEVVVTESYRHLLNRKTALPVEAVRKDFLSEHFTGNLMQTIGNLPGVQSMDIGSGFSKPMIRGLGFNRIAVTENGIKQEGQQWGADHGLEVDAFNVEAVNILKGPASLLYGSDAMGGVIEIAQPPVPAEDMFFGEAALLGKSVNSGVGVSLMLGLKRRAWFSKLRFTEQHFGDYRIPTDTIVYLTQRMPVYGRKLKNTAGMERDVSFFTAYKSSRYQSDFSISNTWQKVGFFPGAHGIPDVSQVKDDGNSRDIGLPYSWVNHLKLTTHQQYTWNGIVLSGDFGYQYNRREEWSLFHTHYASQPVPEKDPDKEMAFRLHTFSSSVRLRLLRSTLWEHTWGWDVQAQRNTIGGYSFLLPEYRRFTTGGYWLTNYRPNNRLTFSGGLRYDYGKVNIASYTDRYLETYLQEQGYAEDLIESNKWRSYPVDKHFGDYSCSVGMVWTPAHSHLLKVNVGRSFRLPGANELASNGVHHGTFRHEQGDASLSSEQGWQLDASYSLEYRRFRLTVSPFASWFDNYIYLKPTGEWSVLPDAGQIYRYTGAKAIFAGGEVNFSVDILRHLSYQFVGEYVYTYNCDEHIPLSFSPPATMRNIVTWKKKAYRFSVECQSIATQNRVARNEDRTPGASLLHLDGSVTVPIGGVDVEISLSARNLLDTKYYNHLSFYRKVEIPEPGRNFQLFIKVPFKRILK